MAKILPGIAVNKISGTINGTTFQNWRGILVARSKPTPTNVNTPRQSFVRSLLSSLASAWRDELNQGQRRAWKNQASSFPWYDVFGNAVSMTGENLYIKQNFHLLDFGRPRVDTPQPDITPPELTDVGIADPDDPNMQALVLSVPSITAGVIASQNPFLVFSVAGTIEQLQKLDAPEDAIVNTSALPQGRTHQKSNFRTALYMNRLDAATTIPAQTVAFRAFPYGVRNIVVSVQSFNKYGNFSAPLLIEGIRTPL